MKSRAALAALGVTVLVGVLLAAISLAHHLGFSTVERLMRDPAATTGASLSLGAAGISLLVRFRATVLRGEAVLLFSAGSALATAVLLDLLPTRGLLFPGASGNVLAEDGAKLLGIFLWATYLMRTAASTIRNARRSTGAPPAAAAPRSG